MRVDGSFSIRQGGVPISGAPSGMVRQSVTRQLMCVCMCASVLYNDKPRYLVERATNYTQATRVDNGRPRRLGIASRARDERSRVTATWSSATVCIGSPPVLIGKAPQSNGGGALGSKNSPAY